MKKVFKILSILLAICFACPISAYAADDSYAERNVGVIIETKEEYFPSEYDFSMVSLSSGIVDLSEGNSTFTVGKLNANATYKTDTYSITKSTIKIGLQSLSAASQHIKITLYKSNGVSVAVTTVSLPWSSASDAISTYVNFTNLDPSNDYYAVIKNTDTTQSGLILGVAKQS